jgi:DNA polymerase elongation subunit (family B)
VAEGWLFDAYPLKDKMIIWMKLGNENNNNNAAIRLEDNWSHSIYVASDNKSDLKSLIDKIHRDESNIASLVKDYELTSRYERITDSAITEVLKLTLSDSTKALALVRKIETLADGCNNNKFGGLRFYNADLLPAQSYFYEHDIFPLAFCEVYENHGHLRKLKWIMKDSVLSPDYKLPAFRTIHIRLDIRKEGKIPKYSDRIHSISITPQQVEREGKQEEEEATTDDEPFEIQGESEANILCQFLEDITRKIDPDFIFTTDGDSFTFPYLIHRAEKNGIDLILGREPAIPLKKPINQGTSYFSYGRTYFKPAAINLHGRIHIDKDNSFIYNDSGLQGLYEISRICRMPLHTAARASIGKCLSSLQFYYANQEGILVPWKPALAEHFKTLEELLIADRGGFIFEPETGVHQQVAEYDFVSLYPNIMLKKNLSAETICCNCCCHNSKLRVPELDYNICEKRVGITPTSLRIVLEKRSIYKQLLKCTAISPALKRNYELRQNSLKWILVTSFGYLGFNNAKFGRIDAHIGVCAFDRQILLEAAKVAERHGFRVIHGIVDSLWTQKNGSGGNIKDEDYLQLKGSIENKTGFKISFEGIYKWIAFVHSKRNDVLPVPNRYFGVFEDGSLKIRGIEARRHDTPTLFNRCQNEILEAMASGNTINEVKSLMPKVKDVFQKYVTLLKERRKVPLEELAFTKRLSKNSNEYQKNRDTMENNARCLLEIEDKSLKAGEILRYVITDYCNRNKQSPGNKRAIPIELIDDEKTSATTTYDVRRYIQLLAETCNSVTEPFGYTITYNNNNMDLQITLRCQE